MKMANSFNTKKEKITLKGYYDRLPEPTIPKREFILEIMQRCHVVETTVFNWLSGRTKATDPKHLDALSQITGIAKEDLWED